MEINLDQYAGLWAVEPSRFSQMWLFVSRLNLDRHIARHADRDVSSAVYRDEDGVRIITISGPMTKNGSSLSGAGSTVRIRQAIRQARRDDSIGGVMMVFDTPGGTTAGVIDLADEIFEARQEMPVFAYVDDLCCSAGVWASSQASRIIANNEGALYGSVGVYVGLHDLSKAAELEGVEPVMISTSSIKGMGFPGTKITDEHKDELRRLVDATQEQFLSALERGRGESLGDIEDIATARVFEASEAKQLGLIDDVMSFDKAMSELRSAIPTPTGSIRKGDTMSEQTIEEPKAATKKDIVEACNGIDTTNAADAQFVLNQLDAEATVEQARDAWMSELVGRVDAANAVAQAATDSAAAITSPGVEQLDHSKPEEKAEGGSASDEYKAEIAKHVAAGLSRPKAAQRVAVENPELRQRYIEEKNADR